jgi:hypothetical protein
MCSKEDPEMRYVYEKLMGIVARAMETRLGIGAQPIRI